MASIARLWWHDLDLKRDLFPVTPERVLDPATMPGRYAIRAEADEQTKSVRFCLDGNHFTLLQRREFLWAVNLAPHLRPGPHDVYAIPASDVTGVFGQGDALRVHFAVAAPPPRPIVKGLVGGTSVPRSTLLPFLTDGGFTEIRSSFDVDWEVPPDPQWFAAARAYVAKRIRIVGCFRAKTLPEAAQSREWFTRAVAAARGAIDKWEVAIPPATGVRDYVTRLLCPASDVLRAKGAAVVGGAVRRDLTTFRQLLDAGYLSLVDHAAYHPGGRSASEFVGEALAVRKLIGPDKRLLLTEANLAGHETTLTPAQWARCLRPMFDGVRAAVDGFYYYRAVATDDPSSAGAILTSSYLPREPFFRAATDMGGECSRD